MATRLLAGFGAEVLRLDPPGYEEWDDRNPTQLTLGKRCARLDLTTGEGRERFLELLSEADVFVHGLRPGVFDNLGLGAEVRERVRPDIVEITHNAYGWTGPWANRRGFDSTVFTSSGLLVESMRRAGVNDPTAPGVVQHVVVDHGVGQMEAASAISRLAGPWVPGSSPGMTIMACFAQVSEGKGGRRAAAFSARRPSFFRRPSRPPAARRGSPLPP
jgi:crotonobetainyl-CoA:carnitine CoA-transferase CaiB-like acyl-CoA transferase